MPNLARWMPLLPNLNLTGIIDILVVAFVVYEVLTVVRGTRPAHRPTGRRGAHHGRQLGDRPIDHQVGSLATSALSDASSSKSAETFPCTSMTRRAVSRSACERSS